MSKKSDTKKATSEKKPRQAKVKETSKATATVAAKAPAMPPLPKMPSASRSRKPKPLHDCKCGCGATTTSIWAPGHDARAKGWCIRLERGICKIGDVPENEQPGAKYYLKLRKETGVTSETTGLKVVRGGKKAKSEPVAAETTATEPAAEVPAEAANS